MKSEDLPWLTTSPKNKPTIRNQLSKENFQMAAKVTGICHLYSDCIYTQKAHINKKANKQHTGRQVNAHIQSSTAHHKLAQI